MNCPITKFKADNIATTAANMTIIEQTTIPKNPEKGNEDGIVVTDDFIAVIDGSTSKSGKRICQEYSNGQYCMLLISNYIKQCKPYTTISGFCSGITDYVFNHYPRTVLNEVEENPEMRMAASCAVYSRQCNEIWMIGDCHCLIDGKYFDNPKPYEDILAEKRAETISQLIASGKETTESIRTNDVGRASIIAQMIETMKNQNKTYSVIDGFPIPLDKVKTIPLPTTKCTVVLATDGYPFLLPTLRESEKALASQKENDPLNIGAFKATKAFSANSNSFDDRTYIRFIVE